ncbi:MAG: hypothetical protein JNL28_13890 [Planctomycetes bacterium]|nr:hypothetical protein [Planctomycetota bacterium]
MRSEQDLARALGEMGLKNVEVHPQAQALCDWIGRPTDVLANVIVRRKDLGASSDDMGFVRAEDGTFDLIVSEIHLFRFDKKWLTDLAARTGTVLPTAGPIAFAASISSPVAKPAAPTQPPQVQNLDQLTRIETDGMLERVRSSRNFGPISCLFFFVPIVPWFILSQLSPEHAGFRTLVGWSFAWALFYFVVLSILAASRVRKIMAEFGRRFPTPEARAAALARLKSVAQDPKHAASQTAQSLLRNVERQARTMTIKPRPPQPPRGPGGQAR